MLKRSAAVLIGIFAVFLHGCASEHAKPIKNEDTVEILVPRVEFDRASDDDSRTVAGGPPECFLFVFLCDSTHKTSDKTAASSSIPPTKPPYEVWYGTNRRPIYENEPYKGFSDLRDNILHYGKAYVNIPKSHTFGSVGSSWVWRTVRLTDDRLRISSIAPIRDGIQFGNSLSTLLRQKKLGERKVLIYIHGYNVTFEEAVIRAAQIGNDLKVDGITAVYSWPSKGSLLGYSADEATVESSEDFLKEFLTRVGDISGVEEIDIIAHSMGNRAFLRAVAALAPVMKKTGKKFGQIILAAPDVDVDVFKRVATIFPAISSRTTLYVSAKDLAVKGSELLHQYARVGLYPPITTVSGIDTIQVSNLDLNLLGHSYYAEAEAVLHDMFDLLRGDLPPDKRIRLAPHPSSTRPDYWQIAR